MRYISINNATQGMILSKTIFDSNNRILLNKGKSLDNTLINRLIDLGMSGIYIDDEISKDIVIEDAIKNETKAKAIKAIKGMNIEAAKEASEAIVYQLLSHGNAVIDMQDLKTFDNYTFNHCVNVAVLAVTIGIADEFNYDMLVELCISAMLHDIGKLKISPDILNKPGKLTDDEYDIIKQHPVTAYNIIKDRIDLSAKIKVGILLHHENEDGSGYPLGIKGKKIHKFAKIIHVADVYDALTSKRSYKEAFSPAESIEYIMGSCGSMFDRDIVQLFLGFIPLYPKGSTVELSNGKRAIVMENYKFNIMRPKLKLLDGTILDLKNDESALTITIIRIVE